MSWRGGRGGRGGVLPCQAGPRGGQSQTLSFEGSVPSLLERALALPLAKSSSLSVLATRLSIFSAILGGYFVFASLVADGYFSLSFLTLKRFFNLLFVKAV